MKRKRLFKVLFVMAIVLSMLFTTCVGYAAAGYTDAEITEATNLIYETEKVTLEGIKVVGAPSDKALKFTLLDTTIQEYLPDVEVDLTTGELKATELIKGHHYLLSLEDKNYEMKNKYFTLDATGALPKDDKTKEDNNDPARATFDSITVSQRATALTDDELKMVNRIGIGDDEGLSIGDVFIDFGYVDFYDFDPNDYDVTFKLVNQYETVELTADSWGWLIGSVIEDLNYSVVMETTDPDLASYVLLSNLITTKNHQERGANVPTDTYSHYTCSPIPLIAVADTEYDGGLSEECKYDPITSLDGTSSLSGIQAFIDNGVEINVTTPNEFLFVSRVVDNSNADKLVMDFDTINMHRYEICKIPVGDFTVATKVPAGKTVVGVYNVDAEGNKVGSDLTFTQNGEDLEFDTPCMALYNTVIEFQHVHDIAKVDAKESSCESEGNIEHYKCNGCNKLYADAEGNTELAEADVKIALADHQYENGVCTVCQEPDPDADTGNAGDDQEPGDKDKDDAQSTPKTGDNTNMLAWILLMGVSIGAIVGMRYKKVK